MSSMVARLLRRFAWRMKRVLNAMAGGGAIVLLKLIRCFDADFVAGFAGGFMRRLGPWLPEHKVGRANLVAAFPEKTPEEIEAILRGVWDNLGRVAAEYAHLDRLWVLDEAHPERGRIEIAPEVSERFVALRDDGRPAVVFAAHLGNWEMPAVGAATYGLDTAILYRAPNIGHVAEAIAGIRAVNMGTMIAASMEAPLKLAAALERGAHAAMLVDQHYGRGVDVLFFGRNCKANPLAARLARHFDCPIHGVRTIRLPGHRFRMELTPEITPVRDAEGRIDVAPTMQVITSVIEAWVREYPEQWLWLHRRWR